MLLGRAIQRDRDELHFHLDIVLAAGIKAGQVVLMRHFLFTHHGIPDPISPIHDIPDIGMPIFQRSVVNINNLPFADVVFQQAEFGGHPG